MSAARSTDTAAASDARYGVPIVSSLAAGTRVRLRKTVAAVIMIDDELGPASYEMGLDKPIGGPVPAWPGDLTIHIGL